MLTPENPLDAVDPKDPKDDDKEYNELIGRLNNLSEQGKRGSMLWLFEWEELQKIEAERTNSDINSGATFEITKDTVDYILNEGLLKSLDLKKIEDAVSQLEQEGQRQEKQELQKNMVTAAKKVIENMETDKRIAFVKKMFNADKHSRVILGEMEYHAEGDFSGKTEEECLQKEVTEKGVDYFVTKMEDMMEGTVLPLFERALMEWEKNEISSVKEEVENIGTRVEREEEN